MEQLVKKIGFDMDLPESILKIQKIFKASGYKLFIVGGAVRDALLGLTPKDFDLATDALPDIVEELMEGAGVRTLATGKSFGVINVFIDIEEFEIATFRSEIGFSDSRRPDSVVFTNIETDVKRRDLTINALFFDIDSKEIVDLVGGVNDLKNKIIRTVGPPVERFSEDRLRILRAIRFAARFGSDLHPSIREALQEDSSLSKISGERIRDEFIKGVKSAKKTEFFLELLKEFHLFKWIFKDLIISHHFVPHKDIIVIIAVLLKDNDVSKIGAKLMLSKFTLEEKRAICFLVSLLNLNIDTAVKLKKSEKIAGVSPLQIGLFAGASSVDPKLLRAFIDFELRVSGEELMSELGIGQGKELGDIIYRLETERFKKLLN
jgi:tRNA nucleotidyltransferase/poly(A) polymerase